MFGLVDETDMFGRFAMKIIVTGGDFVSRSCATGSIVL